MVNFWFFGDQHNKKYDFMKSETLVLIKPNDSASGYIKLEKNYCTQLTFYALNMSGESRYNNRNVVLQSAT